LTIPSNLGSLFEGFPLLDDTDGDGYPDRVALKILVHPDMEDPFVWAGLLNLTARLAFEVIALRLPLLQRGIRPALQGNELIVYPPGRAAPGIKHKTLPPACSRRVSRTVYLCGASGKAMMGCLNGLAGIHGSANPRRSGSMPFDRATGTTDIALNLLNLACLYDIPALRPRARELKAILSIPRHKLSSLVGTALSDLVARMALEATELTLPLVFVGAPKKTGIVLRVQEEETERNDIRVLAGNRSGRQSILLKGDAISLSRAIRDWSSWAFAAGGEGCEEVDLLRTMWRPFAGSGWRGVLGQMGMVPASAARNGFKAPMPPASGKRYTGLAKACKALSIPVPPREKPPKALHRTARWQSETEEVLNRIRPNPAGSWRSGRGGVSEQTCESKDQAQGPS
jgi:hypothetical protein